MVQGILPNCPASGRGEWNLVFLKPAVDEIPWTLLNGLSLLCNVNLSSPLFGTGLITVSESEPVAILVRSPDYPRLYPPSIRVRGIRCFSRGGGQSPFGVPGTKMDLGS